MIRSVIRKVGVFYAVLCGIALTWTAAAFGLALLASGDCRMRVPHLKTTRYLVAEAASAVQAFRITKSRCPSPDALVAGGYVDARALVDPWGTSMRLHCTPDGEVSVRSAGPDRVFLTQDDITND